LLSRHKNSGQNHKIKIANRSFEFVAKLNYFGMTDQNIVNEEINIVAWRLGAVV
jgi:hypothetical protein